MSALKTPIGMGILALPAHQVRSGMCKLIAAAAPPTKIGTDLVVLHVMVAEHGVPLLTIVLVQAVSTGVEISVLAALLAPTGTAIAALPAQLDKFGTQLKALVSVAQASSGTVRLASHLAEQAWSVSMGSALAKLDIINSMASVQNNLLAPQDRHGTVFSALQFNVLLVLFGMALSVPPYPQLPVQLEHIMMVLNASLTLPTVQLEHLGRDLAVKLLVPAPMAHTSAEVHASLSHNCALMDLSGKIINAFLAVIIARLAPTIVEINACPSSHAQTVKFGMQQLVNASALPTPSGMATSASNAVEDRYIKQMQAVSAQLVHSTMAVSAPQFLSTNVPPLSIRFGMANPAFVIQAMLLLVCNVHAKDWQSTHLIVINAIKNQIRAGLAASANAMQAFLM